MSVDGQEPHEIINMWKVIHHSDLYALITVMYSDECLKNVYKLMQGNVDTKHRQYAVL